MEELKVFLASSSELEEERNDIVSTIFEINAILPHVILKPFRWETGLESGSVSGDNIQGDINPSLDESEIIIVLFYSKPGRFTQAEFERSEISRKKIFVYFKQGFSPKTEAEAEDYLQLIRFKKKLERENRILYTQFDNLIELKLRIHRDILLYLKSEYPFAEKSVSDLLRGLNLNESELSFLRGLATLSFDGKGYSADELTSIFVAERQNNDHFSKLLENLVQKGLIVLKEGKYHANSVLRRYLMTGNAGSDSYVDNLIRKIVSKISKALKNTALILTPEDIGIAEQILSDFKNKQGEDIINLKRCVAKSYIRLFNPGTSTRNLNRAIMLLDGITDTNDGTGKYPGSRLDLIMAYVMMAKETVVNADKSKYLLKAENSLKGLEGLGNTEDFGFRYNITKFNVGIYKNGYSEKLLSEFIEFYKNDKLRPDKTIENLDKFYELLNISKFLKSITTSTEIVQMIVDICSKEYGMDDIRLLRPCLESAELLIISNKRNEAHNYLVLAHKIAEKSGVQESIHSVNALFMKWATNFPLYPDTIT
jgi:hypothetical protein